MSTTQDRVTQDRVVSLHQRLAAAGTSLPVVLWDGTTLGPQDQGWRLVVRRPWSLRAALLPPTDLSMGEAYLDDLLDIEGSMVAALRTLSRLNPDRTGWLDLGRLLLDVVRLPRPPDAPTAVARARRVARAGRRAHEEDRDREVVQHHYDVGDELYELFLDEELVYSCAWFHPDDDRPPASASDDALERAQRRKLELVCRKLDLQPGMRLLDVGCGWGALVLHAAEHHGVEAVGITLAENQARRARATAAARGLADRVEIRVQDYRRVAGTFDAVASVGMVEHVGAGMLPGYFARLRSLVAPGGRLLNHGITTGRRQQVRDLADAHGSFVGRHVFPDGALVPSGTMLTRAEEAGFEVVDLEQLRPHYARTLEHWVHRLEHRADEARAAVGDRTYRTWRAYMAGSVVGFETADLGVIQLLCLADGRPPLTREWLPISL